MAQVTFTGDTTPSLADLDANFTEVYSLKNLISTPSHVASTPRMTVDSSGNFGVGTATPFSTAANRISFSINATTDSIFALGTGGTRRGYVYVSATQMNVGADGILTMESGGGTRLTIDGTNGHFATGTDNAQTCGTASKRWSVVYAGTGSINTSDAREKTDLTPMTANEIAAAKQLAGELGTFKFLDAVKKKGTEARIHVGLTVQRAMDVMVANGLDPLAYGFICHDEWPEEVVPEQYGSHQSILDESGAPMRVVVRQAYTVPAGDRYAFRTDELLLFIARGFDARLAALEAAA